MFRINGNNKDRSNRLERPLPLDPETGLYTRNYFLHRLKEERQRSLRSGIPFSLILIDLEGMSLSFNGTSTKAIQKFERKVIQDLFKSTRKIDIKAWLDTRRVALLMPDTAKPEALKIRSKLSDEIRGSNGSRRDFDPQKFIYLYEFLDTFDAINNGTNNKTDPGGQNGQESHQIDTLYADMACEPLSLWLRNKAKRLMDISGALVGIILTAPLMAIIAILVKLTSPGPVLFKQERVGFLGKRFVFLKFRSMYANSDEEPHKEFVSQLIKGEHDWINQGTEKTPVYKMAVGDLRITPVGRFLRKWSLDELPQLFNILKGEMSLVGPRPPIPYEIAKYRRWHYGRVMEVKPGLTGLWQVSGRSQTTFDDMVRLDLHYANQWSLWLDVKIMFKTFQAVLSTKGAF
ncbi:MAG: exopolysaccharide biosynthesis polyprenyl glycosylphosphotransferase [candidate division Zixibacteria bacterium]|nr:exopolysaccharide biosynthesis polyprenyl glycosylphosphotransferase [candidate division Zixibacteria bacterium]